MDNKSSPTVKVLRDAMTARDQLRACKHFFHGYDVRDTNAERLLVEQPPARRDIRRPAKRTSMV